MEDDENLGGGSGGAAMPSAVAGCEEEDQGHQTISVDGTYRDRKSVV